MSDDQGTEQPRMDRGGAPISALASPQDGRLFEGRVARTHAPGDALRYSWGEEHRDAAELARIVEQLPGKPVVRHLEHVDKHPPGLLKSGAPHKVVGEIVSARVDGNYAVAKVFITDPDTIKAIDAGVRELSLGYACRADETGFQRGTYVDHLSVVKRGRCTGVGGVCALRTDGACGCHEAPEDVDPGRFPGAGPDLACQCSGHAVNHQGTGMSDPVNPEHADAKLNARMRHELPAEMFADPAHKGLPLEDENHVRDAMARFNQEKFSGPAARKSGFHHIVARAHELGIDPSGFQKKYGGRLDHEDMTMDLEKQIETLKADNAALKTRADEADARATQAEKDRDAVRVEAGNARKDVDAEKARADQAEKDRDAAIEKARTDASGDFDARVTARVDLITAAAPIVGKDDKGEAVDLAKMSDRAIKIAVVKHVDGDDIAETETDDFVNGMYVGALKRHARVAGSKSATRQAIQQMRTDGLNPKKTGADAERAAQAAMRRDSARRPQN